MLDEPGIYRLAHVKIDTESYWDDGREENKETHHGEVPLAAFNDLETRKSDQNK
jgi:hypothetical protein